jgi:hypothetical protein
VVATVEPVDGAKRRRVRRAMAGDRRRPRRAGERHAVVDPRALAQVVAVRAVDEHEVRVDPVDQDAPDGGAFAAVGAQPAREERHPPALRGELLQRREIQRGRPAVLELAQVAAELSLDDPRVDGRHRLLPDERQPRIGEHQHARDDEHGREGTQRSPPRSGHRRNADSVPPSEPGPA